MRQIIYLVLLFCSMIASYVASYSCSSSFVRRQEFKPLAKMPADTTLNGDSTKITIEFVPIKPESAPADSDTTIVL